jgi:hypothetical protein
MEVLREFIGVKKVLKLLATVVTPNVRNLSELDIIVQMLRREAHKQRLVMIGDMVGWRLELPMVKSHAIH